MYLKEHVGEHAFVSKKRSEIPTKNTLVIKKLQPRPEKAVMKKM